MECLENMIDETYFYFRIYRVIQNFVYNWMKYTAQKYKSIQCKNIFEILLDLE